MDWNAELILSARILLAAVLGGVIGWERENHNRDAGIRTYMAVAVGACAFSIISNHVPGETTRIASQVVTGMGFIGAGVILQVRGKVQGLTTAATLWATAAVGMASAFGMYLLSVLTALLILGTLSLHHLPGWAGFIKKHNTHKKSEESDI